MNDADEWDNQLKWLNRYTVERHTPQPFYKNVENYSCIVSMETVEYDASDTNSITEMQIKETLRNAV